MTVNYLHTVLFNFKDDLSQAERERVVASIESQKYAPGVESMKVYRNLPPASVDARYEWIVMLDFADEHRALAFRTSPEHTAQVARDFTPNHRGYIAFNVHQPFDRKIAERIDSAFRHIEIFNFKPGLTDSEQGRVLDGFRTQGRLARSNRTIVGRNVRPKAENAPFDWMVLMEFATEQDYEDFNKSAVHRDFRRAVFTPAHEARIVVNVAI